MFSEVVEFVMFELVSVGFVEGRSEDGMVKERDQGSKELLACRKMISNFAPL